MGKLGSIVLPPELCRQISRQLSELLNYTVVCKYDESENLFYAQIFDVVFDRFDEVEAKVSDYSNANYERLGALAMMTPNGAVPNLTWPYSVAAVPDGIGLRPQTMPRPRPNLRGPSNRRSVTSSLLW